MRTNFLQNRKGVELEKFSGLFNKDFQLYIIDDENLYELKITNNRFEILERSTNKIIFTIEHTVINFRVVLRYEEKLAIKYDLLMAEILAIVDSIAN